MVALASTVLALVACEWGLRLLLPLPDPWLEVKRAWEPSLLRGQFPANLRLRMRAEAGLSDVPAPSVFSTNDIGFRGPRLGRPKAAGETRIFLVGGSAVECLYLDDSTALHTVLQERLRGLAAAPVVVNAGKSGECSYDHIAVVLHRIVHLEPDLIVVMAGVNDLLAGIQDVDYSHPPPTTAAPLSLPMLLRMTLSEFQIGRRLRVLVHRKTADEVFTVVPLASNYRDKARLAAALPETEEAPPSAGPGYRRNLVSLAAAVRAHHIGLLLVTQPSSWNTSDPVLRKWHWMIAAGGRRYREDVMAAALDAYNEVLRDVGRERGLPVCDLARSIPKARDYFYDDVHFNVGGARAAAGTLAECIESLDFATK
jgi:lysophospholipase L1-like esterase